MTTLRWYTPRHAAPEARALGERALAALRAGRLADRKTGRRKELYLLTLAGPEGREAEGEPDHLLKRRRYTGLAALRRAVRGSRARQELAIAEHLAAQGVATPLPVVGAEERGVLGVRSDLLLVPLLPDTSDLRVLWLTRALAPAELRAVAEAFGALARRAFDAGLFQDDFTPNNVLLRRGEAPELWLIDFERAELRRRVSQQARRWMLAKLSREFGDAPCALRLRFLRAFAGDAARDLWREQVAFAPRLARRDLGRIARNARRGSRRYARAASGAWRGWARSDAGEPPAPDAAAASDLWWTTWRNLPESCGAGVWAVANLLHLRRLAPQPLAFWMRRGEARLAWRAPRGGTREPHAGEEARRAERVLRRRLGAIAEIPLSFGVAFQREAGGPLRALCVDPSGIRVRGRATSPPVSS
jgi:tRNA A-37 threonylcarbamoyl transferase component Bud32